MTNDKDIISDAEIEAIKRAVLTNRINIREKAGIIDIIKELQECRARDVVPVGLSASLLAQQDGAKPLKKTAQIDWEQIDKWIEGNKDRKPVFVGVDVEYWNEALDGIREAVTNVDYDEPVNGEVFGTHTLWHLIWFCAVEFCKGMEYAEVIHGKRKESNYPRI